MECIKISDDMKNDPRPVVSVIGWSNIGEEVSLNLVQYIVTKIGEDDTVSQITSKLDIHILFSPPASLMSPPPRAHPVSSLWTTD